MLLASTPARSETGTGSALKNTAIAGTVASWAVALLKGGPVGDCLIQGNSNGPGAGWGLRLQEGQDSELKMVQVGAERRECQLTQAAGFALDVSPIASVGYWQADSGSTYAHRAFDVAYVPMLHWRLPVADHTRIDFEFGIGPMYMNQHDIGNRQKGSDFQFSDQFGVGLGSSDGKWRIGFAFRHVSNLDIKDPNDAVDFKGVVLSYRP
ncbi:MAG TPA: acyloxyacyl hydrolase [Burkholderiaceae bacterium]|nr:acyloxyacyl hydrolase [Burkholderiaceae bacterium]